MPSVFPALLDFTLIGAFALRITVALFFLMLGSRLTYAVQTVSGKGVWVKVVGFVYGASHLLVGVLLLVGLYTQIAVVIGALLTALTFAQGIKNRSAVGSQQVQFLLFVICISLLFIGPGIFAMDVPL